jgi:hypothetical protein
MTAAPQRFYAVDRIERANVVLVDDDGRVTTVARSALSGRAVREGAVLRVPMGPGGEPAWSGAAVDEAETERRRQDARRALDQLRKRDPGGDVQI